MTSSSGAHFRRGPRRVSSTYSNKHHHQVRIFVEDRDEDSRVASALDLQLRDMDAGDHLTHNLDFFNGSSTTFPSGDQLLAQCAGTGELTY